jgi:hypothetical protein
VTVKRLGFHPGLPYVQAMARTRVPTPKDLLGPAIRGRSSSRPQLLPADEVWLRAKVVNIRDPDAPRGVTLHVEGYPSVVSLAAAEVRKLDD